MKHASKKYQYVQPSKSKENKIPQDEPVFLIRGQDILGPMMLRNYASTLEAMGGSLAIVSEIRAQAQNMETWQIRHGGKLAD